MSLTVIMSLVAVVHATSALSAGSNSINVVQLDHRQQNIASFTAGSF